MMIFNRPFISACENDNYVRLQCLIDIDGEEHNIYLECEAKWRPYLVTENLDAFVVGLLPYALLTKHDICLRAPVSEVLLEKLNSLIRAAVVCNPVLHRVKIDGGTCQQLPNEGKVVTFGSMGVDSTYSILKYSDNHRVQTRLTHIMLNNAGAYGVFFYNGRSGKRIFESEKRRAATVSDLLGLDFIHTSSNLRTIITKLRHRSVVAYVNAFCVLSFAKLFGMAVFPSAYSISEFTTKNMFDGNASAEHFDLLNMYVLSTSTMNGGVLFISDDIATDRFEKTKFISESPIARKYLNVCWTNNIQCMTCDKCKRTVLMLDAINQLEYYQEVFDVDYYKTHFNEYLDYLCNKSFRSFFNNDLSYDQAKANILMKRENV